MQGKLFFALRAKYDNDAISTTQLLCTCAHMYAPNAACAHMYAPNAACAHMYAPNAACAHMYAPNADSKR